MSARHVQSSVMSVHMLSLFLGSTTHKGTLPQSAGRAIRRLSLQHLSGTTSPVVAWIRAVSYVLKRCRMAPEK